ncbi:hypothetical protein BV22DRAFT_1034952 [Leucogyrophana mollusca]|uniref:Uncharacterized protein n=1 Tax=Leucogyrophana mollusca TaxID=85980 RepID=A0ACB8BGE1_9AGAM|nr:hypothetical protein BV22DRAFT_1034952 [Leucogyrophana mollusca]
MDAVSDSQDDDRGSRGLFCALINRISIALSGLVLAVPSPYTSDIGCRRKHFNFREVWYVVRLF